MKILFESDEQDPLVYSDHVVDRYGDVDLVVSAGDLSLKYYEFIISSLNKPFYFIFGNHHVEQLRRFTNSLFWEDPFTSRFDQAVGGEFLDGKVRRDKRSGLLLAGLGGSMRYNSGEHQFTELEMFLRILRLVPRLLCNRLLHGRYLDILVAHAPPRGIGDGDDRCHTGFKVFLWFMRTFRPRYLVHGHVHLFDLNLPRVAHYCETDVINVYGSYLLQEE
jgi:Icc-related predicted phosphoesterase